MATTSLGQELTQWKFLVSVTSFWETHIWWGRGVNLGGWEEGGWGRGVNLGPRPYPQDLFQITIFSGFEDYVTLISKIKIATSVRTDYSVLHNVYWSCEGFSSVLKGMIDGQRVCKASNWEKSATSTLRVLWILWSVFLSCVLQPSFLHNWFVFLRGGHSERSQISNYMCLTPSFWSSKSGTQIGMLPVYSDRCESTQGLATGCAIGCSSQSALAQDPPSVWKGSLGKNKLVIESHWFATLKYKVPNSCLKLYWQSKGVHTGEFLLGGCQNRIHQKKKGHQNFAKRHLFDPIPVKWGWWVGCGVPLPQRGHIRSTYI